MPAIAAVIAPMGRSYIRGTDKFVGAGSPQGGSRHARDRARGALLHEYFEVNRERRTR
jgi:hypothetical protein